MTRRRKPRLPAPLVLCLCGAATVAVRAQEAALDLKSPDGRVEVRFSVSAGGEPRYTVAYRGQPVLAASRLGLVLSNAPALDRGLRVTGHSASTHDETWKPVAAERSVIRDHYHQLVVDLEDRQEPPRRLRLTFRAYDEGAAFCYTVPAQRALPKFTITAEATEFGFTGDHPAWPVYWAQGVYTNVPLSQIKPGCERPLVVQIPGGPTVALGEARLVDYARMRLKPAPGRPHTLQPDLGGPVTASAPYTTPWRFVMVGDSPGQLIERNYLVLNLNDPCALADTSWIRPGKVIREVTLTTVGGKACVDFAVQRGLQYVEFDAGWYGPENSDASDATQVHLDPKRSRGPLDLAEVIRYAGERGIGILLYVNRRALERQLDQILPVYQRWGVQGIKFGFVNVGSQKWTAWLHEAVRQCARYRMVVDIHDEYRPTGFSRTYPNLLTQEGVRGNEEMPPAEHNLILPFTRYLCGPADYTICWQSPRIRTTHAHQLAASMVYFSPLQFLFWYDRPAQCPEEPALDFFQRLPTVWDETRVLHGVIGQYITVARRHGREWFVGTMNAVTRRQLDIPLSFLEPNRPYAARIYRDAQPEGGAPTKVAYDEVRVDATTVLHADLAANGGQAVRITPAD